MEKHKDERSYPIDEGEDCECAALIEAQSTISELKAEVARLRKDVKMFEALAQEKEAEAQEAWQSEQKAQAIAEEMMAERNLTQSNFEEMTERWKKAEAKAQRTFEDMRNAVHKLNKVEALADPKNDGLITASMLRAILRKEVK